ncbi:hypothetical protein Q5P01_009828 [Channa striata]|uniref:Alpha-2-macroglobulin n=1 Tax=Channa striata TaxID=64152 RepID=A0AA88MWQ5_CHASR|nr:hypothetical protein Q5P01_009828 [Channa striata]
MCVSPCAHVQDIRSGDTELNFYENVKNTVSVEFSPSSAVPGEETTMQITADPDSLCGVSAVDQSDVIKEPGKILDADKVSVTPAPSSDYTLSPLSGDQYTSCLCGNERKTVSWTMVPSVLGKVNVSVTAEAVASHVSCDNEVVSVPDRGRVDVVTKSLVVKADGTEMTKNYNWLLCPKGEVLAEELDVQLPENVIDGSARASVSVLGGFLHWSQTATETSASLSVEISSYVLLAKLSASPTAEDLGYSSRIVRWLTGQQNYYGGFSSTQVSVEFSPSSAVPGEQTTMQVTAEPDSLCGVSAVDRSVLIKEPGKILDADKIFNLLPVRKVSYTPNFVQDPTECLTVRSRRQILPYPGSADPNDASTVFQSVGLKMATNLFVRVPLCVTYKGREYHYIHRYGQYDYHRQPGRIGQWGLRSGSGFARSSAPPPPVVTVRTFFPETWIWDLVEVGESGVKDVSLTVPDTITTWETEAFCLSPQGFGLAPRKEIKVFQPFFLELTLPYSIIRGEHFELKATVFNYLTSCIMVSVTPAPSSDYTLSPLSGDQYTSCLCGNERKTVSWTMVPSVLGKVNVSVTAEAVASHVSCDNEVVRVPDRGRVDVVTKSLVVKADGTEMTKNYNWLLCPKGEVLAEELDVQLPENVIDGSARASVSVLGDILGRALQNLDGLLQMPYGCGEQNMALLAPNIYILQYLKDTDQLTPAISEKATNFLVSGYQRQLNYKHNNGAYSTFGSGPGNTWLTAFVLRTFAKAQSFIYIDPTKTKESKSWLENKQQKSGCFKQSGKLFNNRMKGGVSNEVTLSAYITAAFLEMNVSVDDPVVNKSLSCLMESIDNHSNTYTTALLAYVFTLAGDMETRAHLLQHLDTVALDEGGFLHWSQTATETSASLSVEISSYVLLAKLGASPTAEDLGYSSRIVRWLTGQQNYYGGFSSTQDTVVALQALALYSYRVFSPEGSSTVTVQSPSGQLTFDVNQDNKLLYQEKMLQDVTGEFSLEVKGSACASVQISLHYNIPTPTDVITLSVKAEPEANCTSESHRPKLTLKIQSLYSGKEKSTNMVILDIKMLSGFVPHPESLKSLQRALLVDRVEQKEDHVLVYIRELPKNISINHSLELVQEVPVQSLKPAVVQIYDYYQPSDEAETEYIYPCAADKPIYLPGQTVHFRVVTLDTSFRPVNQLYNLIEIEDPTDNRIGQWLNETSNSKILQLSYSLNSEAREGTYQIIVSVGGDKVFHNFKVEKYVLPKFEVKIDAPDEVSIGQDGIKAEVCAKYTYGQPVPGSVTAEMCRPFQLYAILEEALASTSTCHKETKQTDKKGCATFIFSMSTFTKIDQKVLLDELTLQASVEEEGTGISHQQQKKTRISHSVGKLTFIDTPKVYHKGSNVEGKVKAVYYNNTPIAHMPVYLFEGERWSPRHLLNLTTDSDGVATFSISTDDYSGDIKLHVANTPTREYPVYRTAYYETGEHRLSLAQQVSSDAKTVSSLEVKQKDKPLSCDTEEEIFIQYTIVGESQGSVDVIYLVLSRGAIALQGHKQVEIQDKSVNEGEVSFKLNVSPEMAPDVQVVAYAVLPSDTVIAKTADFSTEKCFGHKVSLEFSPSSAVPGEETTMQVTADPDSLCGVSAVDQSVLIKEPGKTLDADKIFNLLPVRKVSYIPYEVQDSEECLTVRTKRYIMPYPGNGEGDDVHTVFQNVGLKMVTNLFIQMPPCLNFKGIQYHRGRYGFPYYKSSPDLVRGERLVGLAGPPIGAAGVAYASAPPQPVVTVRTFFPETWIWDLVEVGESGTTDVSFKVPDTITTWETEAFCLSPQGFGLAPRKEIKVFQPFFLGLTLPYSIIRGEHFELKATVFNYLTSCIMVSVTPVPSSDYTLTPLSDDQYTSCLCGNDRKTVSWKMAPSVLGRVNVSVTAEAVTSHVSCDNEVVSVPDRGRIDVVTKSLVVKAEGTEMTKNYNWLLCPKEEALTENIELQLPENVIDGSARASISVLGDILGRALQNLDGLLQMPYGCGEQNMALLAPNIYILQYLKNTDQLTPAISEKATNFLVSGYQRQLNYKDHEGAYSTFGSGPGNTWLTAFVLRTFAKAQSFIYIDPTKLEQSKTWLEGKQRENGCFEQSGKLFNNRMKGGVSDEVTLSAYITAAFLEMNNSVDDPVITKSLSCLRESINNHSNTYATALLAYVFTLAGDMETRAHLLQHLDTVALDEGGFLHWSQTATETSASLSVEISSYVLLAKLGASPTVEDLGYSSRIVRWLTGQQNYYGGFSSTQDTVVALQALARYATLVFSPEGSSTVTVQSPSGQLTFDVNQDNKLLYQEKMLQDVTGEFSLEVKGSACASIQISLHYNIPTPTDVNTLSVEVKPEADCASESQRPKLTLNLKSIYSGKEKSTNMVILDIKMLSGFVPHPESLKSLQRALLVDRVELKEDHVLVYIRELEKNVPIYHSLELVQEVPVQSLKPAVVQIYDYYQPSDEAETEYIYPCAAA